MVRSRKYLNGAKGASCKVRIPGVCRGGTETTISAHIRDGGTGRSIKASDISTMDCCYFCHEIFDRRARLPNGEFISNEDWLFYALRGLQETLEQRIEAGLLVIPQDVSTPLMDRPVKPRKPKSQRSPILNNKREWPKRSWPKKTS